MHSRYSTVAAGRFIQVTTKVFHMSKKSKSFDFYLLWHPQYISFSITDQSILGINMVQQLKTHRLSVSVTSPKNFKDSCYLQKVIRHPAEHLTLNKQCGDFMTQKVLSGK